jgi:Ca2+-binding EF-hand superfamily protein
MRKITASERREGGLNRAESKVILPGEFVSVIQIEDMRRAFALYEDENSPGVIAMQHVRGILWNFGFWKMSKKDIERELSTLGIDPRKQSLEWGELLRVASARYQSGGKEQMNREVFQCFDKKGKGNISFQDMKTILSSALEVPITDSDLVEVFDMAELSPNLPVEEKDFVKF